MQGARFRHPDTQQWLIRAIPNWVYGGVPGRGVEDAIAPLLIKEYEQSILATLDLTKAFDFANPVLVCRVLEHLGMATQTAQLLQHAWTSQTRFLQYCSETLPTPSVVRSSLPQGDVFSMLGMTALLIPIVKESNISTLTQPSHSTLTTEALRVPTLLSCYLSGRFGTTGQPDWDFVKILAKNKIVTETHKFDENSFDKECRPSRSVLKQLFLVLQ